MPTAAPTLGYGNTAETSLDTFNQWLRGTPEYSKLLASFGQTPNNVHLDDDQKQQVVRLAQSLGAVVDEGNNGQEVDESGNFRGKGHKLRNTLIVAGIAGAALLTMGAAGVFAGAAGAGAGASTAGSGIASLAGIEGGAAGLNAGAVAALGTGAMGAIPVGAGIAGAAGAGAAGASVFGGAGATGAAGAGGAGVSTAGSGIAGLAGVEGGAAGLGDAGFAGLGASAIAPEVIGPSAIAGTGIGGGGLSAAAAHIKTMADAGSKISNLLSSTDTALHNGQDLNTRGIVAASRAAQEASNRYLGAQVDQRGPAVDAQAMRNMFRAGDVASMTGPAAGTVDQFGKRSLVPTDAERQFAQTMQAELKRRQAAGLPLTVSGVPAPGAQEQADDAAARNASNGNGGALSNAANYINAGSKIASMAPQVYNAGKSIWEMF